MAARRSGGARSEDALPEGTGRGGPPPVVTIAARFGAGGSVIGPRVAERLGVLFMDRVIDTSVAERARMPDDVVRARTEEAEAGLKRLLTRLAVATNPEVLGVQQPIEGDRRLRVEVEAFLAEASAHGGVILGRGANFVLRDVAGVLSVLLVGPREARIPQAMAILGLDRRTAEHELDVNDKARLGYVQRNYSREPESPAHYHLILDSTAIALDDVVDLIVRASEARRRQDTSSTVA